MRRLAALALTLATLALLPACDGVGRPVVGERPLEDGGAAVCGPRPSCRTPVVLPADHFEAPSLAPVVDCGVDETRDACPGIPNATRESAPCAAARSACARLAAGEPLEPGADLRGCAPATQLRPTAAQVLTRVNLRCANLTWAEGTSVELVDPILEGTTLAFEAPIAVTLRGGRVLRSRLSASQGASMRLERTEITGSRVSLAPVTSSDALGEPSLELVRASVATTAIHEAPGARPGLVRVEGGTFVDGWVQVEALTVVGGDVRRSRVAARQLDVLDTVVDQTSVRAPSADFAGVDLRRVVFDTCGELTLARSDLIDVSIPRCEPASAVLRRVTVVDSVFGGGVQLEESEVRVSVFGGPDSSLVTFESELEVVSFCDQTRAAFFNGSLRCVGCAERAFDDGAAVCLLGTRIHERGCPAIELAPQCPEVPER